MANNLISITKASQMLGVHPNTLRRWDKIGILKSIRIGERGDRKYKGADLDAVIRKGRNQFKGPLKDVPHIGAGALIVNEKNEVLMYKRKPGEYGTAHYTYPGGRVAFGESPREAAKKEVKLRTGLDVEPGKLLSIVYTSKDLAKGEHPITITFQAKVKSTVKLQKHCKWYRMDDLPTPLFAPCEDSLKCIKEKKLCNF